MPDYFCHLFIHSPERWYVSSPFQHWLTACNAKAFKHCYCPSNLYHDCMVPCVLIGSWASGLPPQFRPLPLSAMLNMLVGDLLLTGLLTAGVLAAIMSSLDSQFLCLGTVFTNDIVVSRVGETHTDAQKLKIARTFIVLIVGITYLLAMVLKNVNVFDLAIWCFSGFSALFPLVFLLCIEAGNRSRCDCLHCLH